MGSLLQYGGLTTKIRAMKGQLITTEEFKRLAELSSVSEFVDNLKKRKSYQDIFEDVEASDIHRGNLEKLLMYGIYRDFSKMYRFSNLNQRKFLKLYFIKYEVGMIKRAIRGLNFDASQSYYDRAEVIFTEYSEIDISKVYDATTIEGIIEALKGTIYYDPLKQVSEYSTKTSFDYEMALDMFFFKYVWKKRKQFKGSELRSISDCIGSEIDSLNILWIYRAKKYYHLDNTSIYDVIIPITFKINKEQIAALVDAADDNDFKQIIENTVFGRFLESNEYTKESIDKSYKKVISKLNNKYFKLNPYSLACMNAYLHEKSEEMKKLITIAESIRYGYKSDAIIAEIL